MTIIPPSFYLLFLFPLSLVLSICTASDSDPSSPYFHSPPDLGQCHKWTTRRLIFPYKPSGIQYDISNKTGLNQISWTGEIQASVYLPYSSTCTDSNKFQSAAGSSLPTSPSSLLCSSPPPLSASEKSIDTIVIAIEDNYHKWIDMLDAAPFGLNLWHFHACFFPIWFSSRLPNAAIHFLRNPHHPEDETVSRAPKLNHPNTEIPGYSKAASKKLNFISKDFGVVLLIPPEGWERISPNNDTRPIHTNGRFLRKVQAERGGHPTSLSGLQAISDGFSRRMIAASHMTSISDLRLAMRRRGFSQQPSAWVIPPGREGLLWQLAHDNEFTDLVKDCKQSALLEYANDIRLSIQAEYSNDIAKHICVMSRQMRSKPNAEGRFKLRNFTPDFFRLLIQRLASPLVMNPNLDIRNASTQNHQFPIRMGHASISGQIRTIHEECAVLLGIHGAGLSNLIGLRKGTAVLEIMMERKQYLFFKNVAALMPDVEYVKMYSEGVDFDKMFEGDFWMNDTQLDAVVEKANELLRKSIQKQISYLKQN